MAEISAAPPARLRHWRPEDQAACEHVCIATGDCGRDAAGLHRYPELLPALYFTPYVHFDPSLAWVVERQTADDAGSGVSGYLVATSDSTQFDHWCRLAWLPVLQNRYPIDSLTPVTARANPTSADSGPTEADLRVLHGLHHPGRSGYWLWREFPAHLHIDLLPSVQGQGLGRQLIETALSELSRRGIAGVHLGVNPRNTSAIGFYERVGFQRAVKPEGIQDGGVFYVYRLG